MEGLPLTKKPRQYSDHNLGIRETMGDCRPWPHKRHCRRRFHAAFFRWYAANEQKFAVKLELLMRADKFLHIGFCNISRIVTALVTSDEISIQINWNGINWDVIRWFEVFPKRVPGGYVGDFIVQDDSPIHPSRQELWRKEIFEPFFAWVNNDLARANAIAVSGDPSLSTWARLVSSTEREEVGRKP
jgi:hypothetical protein